MATLRQRGNKWQIEVYVKGKRRAKTFLSKTKARNWAREMEVKLSEDVAEFDRSFTLSDLFSRYGTEITPQKKSAKTELNRLNLMDRDLGHLVLADLTRNDIESWMKDRLKVVSSSTVKRYITILSNALKYARRWELMGHNPLEDLMVLKSGEARERRIFPQDEEQILLALGYDEESPVTTKNQIVAVAFLLALETAMRSGEILKFTKRDVDLKGRIIHLSAAITKTATKRNVPLSSRAVELIKKLEPWPDEGPVFQISDETRDVLFRRAVNRTLIEDLTFHDTRREATSRLAQKFHVLDLARITGHKDIKMLMTYYNRDVEDLAKMLD